MEISNLINKSGIDLVAFSESKIDNSFPDAQFHIDKYSLYRADRSHNGGGVLCYVRSSIPHRNRPDLSISAHNIECVVIDVRDKSRRCFYIVVYRSPSTLSAHLISVLKDILEKCLAECDMIVLLGDLNVNFLNPCHDLIELLDLYNLKNIIRGATCFKSTSNPSLIDVILTNKPKSLAGQLNCHIGMSDFHNFICSSSKFNVPKLERTRIQYRSFKHFCEKSFLNDVKTIHIDDSLDIDRQVSNYTESLKQVVDKHAPLKIKYVTNKQVPYMNERLRKAVNIKGMLFRRYTKNPTKDNWVKYTMQRNKVTTIKRESIQSYFDKKCNAPNQNGKSFWETVKPFFSNKMNNKNGTINLFEGGKICTETQDICNIFNDYFINVVNNITTNTSITSDFHCLKNHISVLKISESFPSPNKFYFTPVTEKAILSKLKKLNPKKAAGCDSIPSKLIKMAAQPISQHLTKLVNCSIEKSHFPEPLKLANVSPVFKKSDNLKKENFRPVSVLTVISKIYEGVMADQLCIHFKEILSVWLSAYRKRYSTNNVLLQFVEILRRSMDKDEHVGCILMDLSKAFDCLDHNLLLAKMEVYGVDAPSCKLIRSYLSNRKQRVKIHETFSPWKELKYGVPQGSVLGPLLFNIFLNDLFLFFDKDITLINYADDNTIVCSNKDKNVMKCKLQSASLTSINWFTENGMTANPDKFQAIYLKRNNKTHINFDIDNMSLVPDDTVKLLGIYLDDNLSFDYHTTHVCNKAAKQINAIRRLSKVLDVETKLKIYNSFIQSNFNYCSIVYNTFSKTQAQKLEKLNERALRFVYNDFSSSYVALLGKMSKTSLVLSNIKHVAEQVYKVIHNLSPPISPQFFKLHETHYTLRNDERLVLPTFKTKSYGKLSFNYMGAFIWNSLPNDIKLSKTFEEFKNKLKKWTGPNCKCGVCQMCILLNI